MVSAVYALGFTFLASTTLLFILWHVWAHCRAARARQMERRARELQGGYEDAEILSALPLGLSTLARGGAPQFLIRSLPTHVFSLGGKGGAADGKPAGGCGAHSTDVEMGQGPAAGGAQHANVSKQLPPQEQEEAQAEWQQHHHHHHQQQQQQDASPWSAQARAAGGTEGRVAEGAHEGRQPQRAAAEEPPRVHGAGHCQPCEEGGGLEEAMSGGAPCGGGCEGLCAAPSWKHQERCRRRRDALRAAGGGAEDAAGGGSGGGVEGGSGGGGEGSDGGPPECTICLCSYADGEVVKHLPCSHSYHAECIDVWLRKSATCPLCKLNLYMCF